MRFHDSLGQRVIKESLKTSSVAEARTLRDIRIAELSGSAISGHASDRWLAFRASFEKEAKELAEYARRDPLADTFGPLTLLDFHEPHTFKDEAKELAFKYVQGNKAARPKLSLRSALETYLKHRKPQYSQTSKLQRAVALFLEFVGKSDVPLFEIKGTVAADFLSQMVEQGVAQNTIKNWVTSLASIWQHNADLEEHVAVNPFKMTKAIVQNAKAPTVRRAFTDEELSRLVAGADRDNSQDLALLVRLAIATGARRDELAGLTVDKLQLDAEVPHIIIAKGKTVNARRVVPIGPELVARIKAHLSHGDSWLFTEAKASTRKDGKHGVALGQRFTRLKSSLGMNDKTAVFHCFRHNFATRLERAGVPAMTAAELLGHSKADMGGGLTFGLYSKGNTLEALAEAVEKANESVRTLLE